MGQTAGFAAGQSLSDRLLIRFIRKRTAPMSQTIFNKPSKGSTLLALAFITGLAPALIIVFTTGRKVLKNGLL